MLKCNNIICFLSTYLYITSITSHHYIAIKVLSAAHIIRAKVTNHVSLSLQRITEILPYIFMYYLNKVYSKWFFCKRECCNVDDSNLFKENKVSIIQLYLAFETGQQLQQVRRCVGRGTARGLVVIINIKNLLRIFLNQI